MNLGAEQHALSSRFLAVGFVDRTRTAVRAAEAAAPIELSGSGEPTTIKPEGNRLVPENQYTRRAASIELDCWKEHIYVLDGTVVAATLSSFFGRRGTTSLG